MHDFFVAGRTRNSGMLEEALRIIRKNKKTAWCFLEKSYLRGADKHINLDDDKNEAQDKFEELDQNDALVKRIFEDDLAALRNSNSLILVLPAGKSGHIEAGIAYGLGKKCYAIGKPEKTESLYCIFDRIFVDFDEFEAFVTEGV